MVSARRRQVTRSLLLWLQLVFATGAAAAKHPPPRPPPKLRATNVVFGSFYVIVIANAGALSSCPALVDPAVTLAASLNVPIASGVCLNVPGGMMFSAAFTDGNVGMKAVAGADPDGVCSWAKRHGVCGSAVQIVIVGSTSNSSMNGGNVMARFNMDGSSGAVGLGAALSC